MFDRQRPEEAAPKGSATEGTRGTSEGLPEPLDEEVCPPFNTPQAPLPGPQPSGDSVVVSYQEPRKADLFFAVGLNPGSGLDIRLVLDLHRRWTRKKQSPQ